MGQKIAIRCLGSREHKGKSREDLIKIIKKLGTDKYDPDRKGDRYDNVEKKHIDFFALDFTISPNNNYMEFFIEPFYAWPKKLRGTPVRIDIVLVYDCSKIKRVLHRYEGRSDIKKDGFVFKNPEHKKDALIGIIKIL